MKLFLTSTILATLLISCIGNNSSDTTQDFLLGANDDVQNNQKTTSFTSSRNIKMFQIMDTNIGLPIGGLQIPSAWKERGKNNENIMLEGPNGLKIYHSVSNHSNLNDQIKNIDQLIEQDLKPIFQKQGFILQNKYSLPEMAQLDHRTDNYLYKSTPEQKQFKCVVTEWINQKGISSMIIIRYYTANLQMGGWYYGYTLDGLEAQNNYFQEAKNIYINALLNFQINPQWIKSNNQYWAQKNQQATIAHNQRMQNIIAFGNISTRLHNQRMADMDAQYNSWRAGQAASDASHSRTIDGIWEQRNMTNLNTGQTYKIEGYDNNVWMNQNNQYFGTDNYLYNPNTDPTMHNQSWDRLENNDN